MHMMPPPTARILPATRFWTATVLLRVLILSISMPRLTTSTMVYMTMMPHLMNPLRWAAQCTAQVLNMSASLMFMQVAMNKACMTMPLACTTATCLNVVAHLKAVPLSLEPRWGPMAEHWRKKGGTEKQ